MVQTNNIRKFYQMKDFRLEILNGIDVTIKSGEFVAIMGPSGSGKSTLMNILGLLDVPSSGKYQLNGIETSNMNEDQLSVLRREEIGFIFQQFNLLPRLSALENVQLPLIYTKKPQGIERAQALLKQVGLFDRKDHKTNQLSGGQQQRVAIARALINEPNLIFADEPTGNLDSKSQLEIMSILEQLNKQGITIVIVTHEESVAQKASRLIRIKDGLILSDEKNTGFVKNIDSNIITVPVSKKVNTSNQTNSFLDFLNYFRQGFRTLAANKIRTGLSMLGILIGVAAVVAMLAIGKGAQNAIQEQLSSLGSNLLMIRPGAVRVGGVSQESGAANRLSIEDIEIIKNRLNIIKGITGQINGRVQATGSGVGVSGKNWNTSVQGNSTDWAEMHNSVPVLGRFFTVDEDNKRARVAVIGETVRRELFGEKSAIGESIKINKVIFQIIGILPEKGGNSWRDQDDVIIIPLQTAMRRLLGREFLEMIEVEVQAVDLMEQAQESIAKLLTEQHKIPLSQQSDAFQIRNMADIQAAMQQSSETMSLLLASIAAISLLVGGIGIMNIMLVSVTERTREIGLRKAIGARRADILWQFLSESVVVSFVGGFMGVILGWIITLVLTLITGWSTSISLNSVLLSFFFSVLIGIIFGVYPAKKAASLNPIDALRFE